MTPLTPLSTPAGLAFALLALPAMAYEPDFVRFDGDAGMTIPGDAAFNLATGGTIEFWVAPDCREPAAYDPVVLSAISETDGSYLVAILRDCDGIGLVSGDREGLAAFDFNDGEYHHVAINTDADGTVVLIDTRPVGEFDFSLSTSDLAEIWVGSADAGSARFTGEIGGIRLWGRPLEPDLLRDFALQDLFGIDGEVHPSLDDLKALSIFPEQNFLIVESIEESP